METQFALETFETHEKQPFYNLDWIFWRPAHLYKTLDLDSGLGGLGQDFLSAFYHLVFFLIFQVTVFFYYKKLNVCTCQWSLYCMKLYETNWQLASCAIVAKWETYWARLGHRTNTVSIRDTTQKIQHLTTVFNYHCQLLVFLHSSCLCFKVVQWMLQSDATGFHLIQHFLPGTADCWPKTEQASSLKIFPQLILIHISPHSSSADLQ